MSPSLCILVLYTTVDQQHRNTRKQNQKVSVPVTVTETSPTHIRSPLQFYFNNKRDKLSEMWFKNPSAGIYPRFVVYYSNFMGNEYICRSWVRASQIYSNIYPTRLYFTQFIYICKLLYMFRVLLPPIIRSAYNCIYRIWYLSHR